MVVTSTESSLHQASHLISQRIYRALTVTSKHHPEWLIEKYRAIDWVGDRMAVSFTDRLTHELEQASNRTTLLAKATRYLHLLFTPSFMEMSVGETLRQDIQQILEAPVAETIPETSLLLPTGAIAVLLLDAENMHLTPSAEQALQRVCQYPVRIKVAFGNWRSSNLSKHDVELHQRGYQMIHVPAGKNSADMQMTAIGASIFIHHPTAREVLVCSSDNDLANLRHSLQFHGLTVYSVKRQDNQLVVENSVTHQKKTVSVSEIQHDAEADFNEIPIASAVHPELQVEPLASKKKIQSPQELEKELAAILRRLTSQLPGSYINISALAIEFRHRHGRSVSELLKSWKSSARYITFLRSCSSFKLKQVDQHWQITLA
jgi:hypothetical protein